MRPRIFYYVVGGIAAVLLAACAVLWIRLQNAQGAQKKAAFDASNERARAAAQFEVNQAAVKKVYGDSVKAVSRLAVQEKLRADAIDRELKQTKVANLDLTATIDELRSHDVGTVVTIEDTLGIRRNTFDIYRAPYTIHATVALAPPSAPPRLNTIDLNIIPDVAIFNFRFGCGEKDSNGIYQGKATGSGPKWITLKISKVEMDPGTCNDESPPCKIPGTFGRIPCPSRTMMFAVGTTLGAVGGFFLGRQ